MEGSQRQREERKKKSTCRILTYFSLSSSFSSALDKSRGVLPSWVRVKYRKGNNARGGGEKKEESLKSSSDKGGDKQARRGRRVGSKSGRLHCRTETEILWQIE